MASRQTWLQTGLPLLGGLWIGWMLGGMERSANLAPTGMGGHPGRPAPVESTPDVAAEVAWGQHVPRALSAVAAAPGRAGPQLRANVPTDFNPEIESPRVHETAYLDRMASVIGDVEIGARVYVAPFASLRGDEGQPIHIGEGSNVQDGVVIHALETVSEGRTLTEHTYEVEGRRYAVYVGKDVSLAHQSNVHGPAWIEDGVFIGMQALVFRAHVGKGCVIEPAARIIGVHIPPGRYVPAGSVITSQQAADRLPEITYAYSLRNLNRAVLHVNQSLAEGYRGPAPASAGH